MIKTDDSMKNINNTIIPFSLFTKYLGNYMDINSTWKAHKTIIHNTYNNKLTNKKFSKEIDVFLCRRNESTHKFLRVIYDTLILLYLAYCCIICVYIQLI